MLVAGAIRFAAVDQVPSPVPLPASIWLLGMVVTGVFGLNKFRSQNK
jgi:hypothetical protein